MAELRPGPGLRNMVLTPQKIPDFLIPCCSPRITRTQWLSDPNDRDGIQGPCQVGSCDLDLSTRAALSLPHVARVTAPYGFNAVLAASPCTLRRESLYHRRCLAKDPQEYDPPSASPCPSPGQSSSRSWLLRPQGQELESLYHCKPSAQDLKDSQDVVNQHSTAALSPSPGSGRSRLLLLGQQLVKGLQKPVAALKAWSPAHPKSKHR